MKLLFSNSAVFLAVYLPLSKSLGCFLPTFLPSLPLQRKRFAQHTEILSFEVKLVITTLPGKQISKPVFTVTDDTGSSLEYKLLPVQ